MEINRKEIRIILSIFLVSLIYYAINCPPNVTVEDSGDFLMGLSSLGIIHGPSFPLYTILGFFFSKIPIGEIGFRIAFFSAFFGSLSLALCYLFQRLVNIRLLPALLSTIALGLTNVYMGQSIIAEVYSLNLFFVLLLFIFTKIANSSDSPKWIFLMGVTTGSGLIHHYPLFLVSCSGLVLFFNWKSLNLKKLAIGLLGLILGLLPFLYLIIQMNNPSIEYNFGKVSSWEMLWKQFLREGYKSVDEAGGTFNDKLILSWAIIKHSINDFKVLILFIPIGLYKIKKNKLFAAILVSCLTSSFLIIALLGFTSKAHHIAATKAYLMPFYFFLTVFISIGITELLGKFEFKKAVTTSALCILLIFQGYFNFSNTSHYNDDFIYLWAKKGLESLEKDSVLILCGQEPYALYYTNKFLKVRPDVTLYDRLSVMTEGNLYSPGLLFWKVKSKESFAQVQKLKEVEFIKNTKRPVYITCKDKFIGHGFDIKQTVYFNRIINRPDFVATNESKVLSAEIMDSVVHGYPKSEYWLDSARNMVLFNAFSFYIKHNSAHLDGFLKQLALHKNFNDLDFIHAMLEEAYKIKNYNAYEKLIAWKGTDQLNSKPLARYCTYQATKKKYKAAWDFCNKALMGTKSCNIPLLNNLMFISFQLKKYSKSKYWATEIKKCNPSHKGANSLLDSIK